MKKIFITFLLLGAYNAGANSTPLAKANKIIKLKLGCQIQREALEMELARGHYANLELIANLKTTYEKCFNSLQNEIVLGDNCEAVLESLIEKRLICEKEIINNDIKIFGCKNKVMRVLMN